MLCEKVCATEDFLDTPGIEKFSSEHLLHSFENPSCLWRFSENLNLVHFVMVRKFNLIFYLLCFQVCVMVAFLLSLSRSQPMHPFHNHYWGYWTQF